MSTPLLDRRPVRDRFRAFSRRLLPLAVLLAAIAAGASASCGRSSSSQPPPASGGSGGPAPAAPAKGGPSGSQASAPVSAAVSSPIVAAMPQPSPVPDELAAIVEAHRQIIVLLEDEMTLGPEERRRADLVARLLFHENHQRVEALGARLQSDLTRAEGQAREVTAFLDVLESHADLRDADKLAVRDIVSDLLRAARAQPAGAVADTLRTRLGADDTALAGIQARYDAELEKIFGRFETPRGMTVRRESWESYVTFLRSRYRPAAILEQHAARVRDILQARGGAPAREQDSPREINGRRLPPKSVVLTFDDGPHAKHTDAILAILKKFGVKAVFFHVGKNIGAPTASGIQATPMAAASRRLLAEGHTLANHSYSHELLPKLSDVDLANQIELTERMLRSVAPTPTGLFRPPYGARNEKVRAALEARRMLSVMWNVDSKDWADPVPRSIANRVIRAAEGQRGGIILFHDIQARTVDALPAVIETLQSRGYRFLTWKGSAFVDENPPAPAQLTEKTPGPSPYRQSWAVIVGIDQYKHWPRLAYAANDARGMRDVLIRKYRFDPEKIVTLLNEAATREAILAALGDTLSDATKVSRDDRVFVFFAGHGITRRLPNGRVLGYLVPVDADREHYQSQAISMTHLQDISDAIPAKHVFFVADACYGGLALTRGAGGQNYLQEVARRTARQVLTAGGADEEVSDNGPNGHSIFTWTLMQGLEGRADLNGDQFITGSELAAYVGPVVSSVSRQTPAFGNLPGSEGGEFVFELPHETEFLNELSTQLDQEAITLNAELDRVRAEIAAKRSRNSKLREELKSARAGLAAATAPVTTSVALPATGDASKTAAIAPGAASTKGPASAAAPGAASTMAAIDRGMTHFRERRYQEALAEFLAAAQASPSNPLAANNVGYTFYRMDRLPESVEWFEKTVALDPRRAIAYANLGDALFKLERRQDARTAYEKYLALSPQSRYAATVRERLASLGGGTRPQ